MEARRIWLNLELIKKPLKCLEYVVAHELTHFFERDHSERFVELLDSAMPNWRTIRAELNAQPLAHESW
ncbi:MAG: M48 family metallopeptidase [Phyllobacterium sp.]|uniref:M48 metallopeptidase family protein n=1 Tax=Phyllobacterium sp. TaxID=1871046 RepID=UPI0030F048CC